ncbi:DNA starvation/stationary phase protection protein Dps [Aetokthonos hydrillicola Thurmond2011]|jgi:starvation-inducible DNA-binding protein|uniref:DNA starvation/stationary phase protection protein Dps n=1 Tax=Aetokthonos hydrillicola Thurmond2011 TaxID=2712845 RepID=A0AAP5I6H6_9CYAN|nr:DNA starvation/stationary phase protection protein Dps [Aetokthonos hydrillicola]MBO3460859.1 DNA starvation/stationary phase protection protein Dps [Aetokthonos hydrillicola CCALA 1050]MBW4585652.1 DNA starvation/stationary phase protection protein Dps [Aetokthonos hydrillicola CCALA 1050]MDR9894552.1 DNA starvation/stationary phase protection protein Dps [Aetokthonos hydrillicola Thurmond2011]
MNSISELHTPAFDARLISISPEAQTRLVDILNQTLATTVDLKTQVKQAQWNVTGINSYHLYEIFDEIATELDLYIDMLAERITLIGGLAIGTARNAVKQSILPEYPLHIIDAKDHVVSLAERLAIYGTLLWENIDRTSVIGDADTAHLYSEISLVIDKRLWFLDALIASSKLDPNSPQN